jgi:hypothetical protein
MALLGLAEIHAGDAQVVDAGFLIGSDLTLDIDEALVRFRQPLERHLHVQPGQHGLELLHRLRRIADRVGIRVSLARRLRDRERLTVAVDDHRARTGREDVGDGLQRPFRDRRHRLARHLRVNRIDDGDPGDPKRDHGEHGREQAGGDHQPAAAALDRFTPAPFGGGDLEMLHAQHRVPWRRTAADPQAMQAPAAGLRAVGPTGLGGGFPH